MIFSLARIREEEDRIKIDSSRCRDLQPTIFYHDRVMIPPYLQ